MTVDIVLKIVPEISVLDGNSEIANGAILNIDATGKEIMIQNAGTAPLTLSNFVLSENFQIDGEFPATIDAGGSKSFKIKLSTTKAGEYSGEVKFNTNDTDESSITFQLKGKIESKTLTSQVFQNYQGCLDYCNSCTDEACHNNCKDDACGQSLLATVQLSDMNMDDFCKNNPTMEACIVKKVCSGKPEACGITGSGNTIPTVAQCKIACKDDPFGCVGIVEEDAEFASRRMECDKFTTVTATSYLQVGTDDIIGTLYLPTVDIFSDNLEEASKSATPAEKVCVIAKAKKDQLHRAIFQVIDR
jgi:hypothetical protein